MVFLLCPASSVYTPHNLLRSVPITILWFVFVFFFLKLSLHIVAQSVLKLSLASDGNPPACLSLSECPGTHYVAQRSFRVMVILLTQPLKC